MHTLYTGVTQSGKTTLARVVSRQLAAKSQPVVVFDPMATKTAGGDWGSGAIVFSEPMEYLEFAYSPRGEKAHHFVDEAHKIFGHGAEFEEHYWMLTEGRHYGMFMHLITQRPNRLPPDVRAMCEKCFMFRLTKDDAYSIAADYGFDDVHRIKLDKGDFIVLNSGSSEIQRANIFQLLKG